MMALESLEETVGNMRGNVIDEILSRHIPADSYPETWDLQGLREALIGVLNIDLPIADWAKEEGIGEEEVSSRIHAAGDAAYAQRIEKNGADVMRYVEKQIVLQVLDHFWREHLVMLDHLRQVIGWRGYAQRDPLNEYKSEAFELFNSLISRWHEMTTSQLVRVEVAFEQQPQPETLASEDTSERINEINSLIERGELNAQALLGPVTEVQQPAENRDPNDPSTWGKIGRNEACPCGSGKKYKHCHGVLA